MLQHRMASVRPTPSSPANVELFNVVLKVAERCNLVCPYCYFFFGGDESYKQHPAVMPQPVVEKTAKFLSDAVDTHGIRTIRIGFHGGEPLLLKKSRFAQICGKFQAELAHKCRVIFVVQTNGVLIDEGWVDLFEEFNVRVGVSFDGPEDIHDIARITKSGKGTYARSRKGWELLLQAAGAGRIRYPGILCVVSPEHDGTRIFRHFADDLRAHYMSFLLPDVTRETEGVDAGYVDRCGKYMLDVFRAWSAQGDPDILIRFVNEITAPLVNDDYLHRSILFKHDPFNLITVSSDGAIAPDDTLRGLTPRMRDTGLNVGTSTLHDVFGSDQWQELRAAHDTPPQQCLECLWRNLCKGGSPYHRFSEINGFDNPSVFCPSLKSLHSFVASNLARAGYSVDEMQRRLDLRIAPRAESRGPAIAAI
jgi:uncharacterized protein